MTYLKGEFYLILFISIISLNVAAHASAALGERTAEIWLKAGFQRPRLTVLTPEFARREAAISTLTLNAVVFRGTPWTLDIIKNRLALTAQQLWQCKLQVDKINIVELDAPRAWFDNVTMPNGREIKSSTIEIIKRLPPVKKPIIFYLGLVANGVLGYARTERNAGGLGPSVNTAWISSGVLLPALIKERGAAYMTEAHELGHLLAGPLDLGHSIDPQNVMSGLGAKFSPEQCELYVNSELVNQINK